MKASSVQTPPHIHAFRLSQMYMVGFAVFVLSISTLIRHLVCHKGGVFQSTQRSVGMRFMPALGVALSIIPTTVCLISHLEHHQGGGAG